MFGKANNSNSQGENAREYEYEKEKQTEKQSIGKNKEFIFKYSQDEKLRQKLKTPRSRAYMEALSMIDLLSATDEEIIEKLQSEMDEDTLEEISEMSAEEIIAEIMTSVREELETAIEEAGEQLVGVLSKCYISGCDVHAIDQYGNIIEHYKKTEGLPTPLDKGRELFHKNPNCKCVEVYTGFAMIVDEDSTVTEVRF